MVGEKLRDLWRNLGTIFCVALCGFCDRPSTLLRGETTRFIDSVAADEQLNIIFFLHYCGKCRIRKMFLVKLKYSYKWRAQFFKYCYYSWCHLNIFVLCASIRKQCLPQDQKKRSRWSKFKANGIQDTVVAGWLLTIIKRFCKFAWTYECGQYSCSQR